MGEYVSTLLDIENFSIKILLFSVIFFGMFLLFLIVMKFAIDNKLIFRLKNYI